MHALIIEDEDLIAMSLEEILGDCGFTSFDRAISFEEAVTAARRRCPDLITADVELKPGSGIDAVQSICFGKAIPVIFITGRADAVQLRMPERLVLDKPFHANDVAAAVRRALHEG